MNYNRETVRNGVTNPPNSYNIEPNIGPNIIPMPVDISSKLITFDQCSTYSVPEIEKHVVVIHACPKPSINRVMIARVIYVAGSLTNSKVMKLNRAIAYDTSPICKKFLLSVKFRYFAMTGEQRITETENIQNTYPKFSSQIPTYFIF